MLLISKKLWVGVGVSFGLVVGVWMINGANAQTCASFCGPRGVQFVPGQQVNVEIVNLAPYPIKMQRVPIDKPMLMGPNQEIKFKRGASSQPNLSMMLWNEENLALRVEIRQPKPWTLRVEVRQGGRAGIHTVYLENDGRVSVF